MQTIYFGSDHGGFVLKNYLIRVNATKKNKIEDVGPLKLDPEDDYPEYAFKVAERVSSKKGAFGVLVCRSGAGMCIAANKVHRIRAVECLNVISAKHAREHNDANILVLSGDWLTPVMAKKIFSVFINTPFSKASRHLRRIRQISAFEKRK